MCFCVVLNMILISLYINLHIHGENKTSNRYACSIYVSCYFYNYYYKLPTPVLLGFPVAQLLKNPPTMQETWVQSLHWEDPLEEGKGTHSSILAWRIPWSV